MTRRASPRVYAISDSRVRAMVVTTRRYTTRVRRFAFSRAPTKVVTGANSVLRTWASRSVERARAKDHPGDQARPPCPTAAVDVSQIATTITPTVQTIDLSLAWPNLSADGEAWPPPLPPTSGVTTLAQNGQHKSRFALTFLEGNTLLGTSSNFDNTFSVVALMNTDPISPNADASGTMPANNVLQPPTPVDPLTKLQTSPPGKLIGVLGPGSIDYGDYMSVAVKYPIGCAEAFASTTSVETSIQCDEASTWPFWPTNVAASSTVGLLDSQFGGTN